MAVEQHLCKYRTIDNRARLPKYFWQVPDVCLMCEILLRFVWTSVVKLSPRRCRNYCDRFWSRLESNLEWDRSFDVTRGCDRMSPRVSDLETALSDRIHHRSNSRVSITPRDSIRVSRVDHRKRGFEWFREWPSVVHYRGQSRSSIRSPRLHA